MVTRLLIVLLSVVIAGAIPRASNKDQLQRLVRLPRVEFAPPLEFDRAMGFMIFPDSAALSQKAAELGQAVKTPEHAEKALEAGKLYDLARNHGMAVREYSRALDLFRRRIELYPADNDSILRLAEVLVLLGHYPEAEVQLSKAFTADRESADYFLVKARFHRERAWQLASGDQFSFGSGDLLDRLTQLIDEGVEPDQIDESKAQLNLAETAFHKALELKKDDLDVQREQAAFVSFKGVLSEAFALLQSNDSNRHRRLREKLFSNEAIAMLRDAAHSEKSDAETVGSAAMALFVQATSVGTSAGQRGWMSLADPDRAEIRDCFNKLRALSESENSKTAAQADEILGCLQFYLLGDSVGGERSFRKSLDLDPKRVRAWDLLIVCLGMNEDQSALVEACEERAASEMNVRSKTLLAKAYDRAGDSLRAQLSALEALSLNSNDFLANLTLATLLLKRDDFEIFTGRVQDCLNKAQRQIGFGSSPQNYVDLALTKAIFYALTDEAEKARAALNELPNRDRNSKEVQDVMTLLSY